MNEQVRITLARTALTTVQKRETVETRGIPGTDELDVEKIVTVER